MARRKLPKIDLCRLRPERFRDMSSDQLMSVWARLGMSAPAHRKVNQKIKALVVAHSVAKTIRAKPDSDGYGNSSAESYERQAERLEREIWDMQAKAGCKISGDETVARDAERVGDKRAAARIRKKPIIR